jgi:hypothetical protein
MQQHWLALQWHGDLGHLEEDHDTVMAEQKPVVFQESFGGHSSRQCCSFDSSDFLVFFSRPPVDRLPQCKMCERY